MDQRNRLIVPSEFDLAERHLRYMLDVRESHFRRELSVEPIAVGRATSGLTSAAPLTDLDHEIASLIEYAKNGRVRTAIATSHDRLLRLLCESERCHWRSFDGPILSLGVELVARFSWRVDADGRQRPAIAGESSVLLPTNPPWYVDPETGRAGPVDLGISPAAANSLASAPALNPRQAERARALWDGALSHLRIERPERDVRERVIDEAPTPVATLRGGRVPAHLAFSGARNEDRETLDLRFDYAGTIVEPGDPRGEFRRMENGEMVIRHRRRDAEERAIERVRELGLRPQYFAPDTDDGRALQAYTFERGSNDRWARALDVDVPALRADGWRIEIDESFRIEVLHADEEWDGEILDSENRWFEFDLGVEIEGERVSLLPIILDAIRRAGTSTPAGPMYGRLADGRFLALPQKRLTMVLSTLVELADSGTELTAQGRMLLSPAHVGWVKQFEIDVPLRWAGAERLREFFAAEPIAEAARSVVPPHWFTTELRPYQREGVAWLQRLRSHRFGGILADDMGLGKTVQCLAHLAIEKTEGRLAHPCLVVCPTSVVPNWLAEAHRFVPEMSVVVLTGPDRVERFDEASRADIVLTSYPLLLRDREELLARQWSIVVLDEAQAIKNPSSKGAKIALQLSADQRIVLTGTPIENHLEELWSLATFAVPGMLGDRRRFGRIFRTPIEKRGDDERRSLLARRLKPFLLRRSKVDVAAELPAKTEIIQRVELSGRQRDLYETIRLAMHERVRHELANRGLSRSRIVVLDALLKLRQVCCDPRLVKIAAAREVGESAKLEALLDMLPSLIDDGRRVLLFSQFTSMLDLIVPRLNEMGIPFVELRGTTRDRATPVQEFQAGKVPLFLISLKAGGTGLNLTAADTVIHYDPWWNPAVENQATDRAHRIGQLQRVFVYKLIVAGSVEERILEMQERKGALAASLFDEAKAASTSLDVSEIERLFAPLDEIAVRLA